MAAITVHRGAERADEAVLDGPQPEAAEQRGTACQSGHLPAIAGSAEEYEGRRSQIGLRDYRRHGVDLRAVPRAAGSGEGQVETAGPSRCPDHMNVRAGMQALVVRACERLDALDARNHSRGKLPAGPAIGQSRRAAVFVRVGDHGARRDPDDRRHGNDIAIMRQAQQVAEAGVVNDLLPVS